ncbi:MAG: hypothetical protein ACLP3C_06395 [Mycobacterium sp.]
MIGPPLLSSGAARFIPHVIDCPDTPIITSAEAQKLGRALIAAADAADG